MRRKAAFAALAAAAPHAGNRDFALLCATGKPFSGNCEFLNKANLADNLSERSVNPTPGELEQEGVMDLAMAMGVALFGMFTASTYYFFHSLKR
ncbi:hypothetical protein [Paraburkholderia antibiotica]|uniref:Uncharacterized protein n=1 Tax=Paraburkholderia antibiotica TaxID=2728839 RepID=A0A7X9ZUZ5_9BURK|nr:hypothetical protein [Paraburkholderia antibiotica]NML29619.1 hypothetical protein [Paraburkholderia antibiotica]